MKNIGLILAGGVGSRVQSNIPKQFIEVYGKPIIIYTLEQFQNNDNIDGIVIVCLSSYIDVLKDLCKKYSITKVQAIVENGSNLFYSTKNGLNKINELYSDEKVYVMIHESVRPFITREMIDDAISVAEKYGNAVSGYKSIDESGYSIDSINIDNVVSNKDLYVMTNPHTFLLNDLLKAYDDSNEQIGNEGTAVLMDKLGYKLYLSKGNQDCFKITTSMDVKRFECLINLYK